MSTTSTKTPEDVKAEVMRALHELGIEAKEKGYVYMLNIVWIFVASAWTKYFSVLGRCIRVR